jgi:hypothetical protein
LKDRDLCTCRKEINELTREERIILELLDQIEDSETKIKYLSQIGQKDKIITNIINYSITMYLIDSKKKTSYYSSRFTI